MRRHLLRTVAWVAVTVAAGALVAGAVRVAVELRGRGEIDARIGAEEGRGLLLAVVHLVNLRPLGPRLSSGC